MGLDRILGNGRHLQSRDRIKITFGWLGGKNWNSEKTTIYGKAKDVPRPVHVHVIDGIDSHSTLRTELERVSERVRKVETLRCDPISSKPSCERVWTHSAPLPAPSSSMS